MSALEQSKETLDESRTEACDNAGGKSIKVDESQNGNGSQKEAGRDNSQQEEIVQHDIEPTTKGLQTTVFHEPLEKKTTTASTGPPYSSFGPWEKRFIVFAATMGAFFSPFTTQVYFPALNTIAKDLHVSPSKINLTLTTYMASLIPFDFLCNTSDNISDTTSHSSSLHWRFLGHRW